MAINSHSIAKMRFVNGSSITAPLTIGNDYEVIAWVGAAAGLQGVVIDDNGNLYIASYMATTSEWTVVAV
jgi:hypothetical protein